MRRVLSEEHSPVVLAPRNVLRSMSPTQCQRYMESLQRQAAGYQAQIYSSLVDEFVLSLNVTLEGVDVIEQRRVSHDCKLSSNILTKIRNEGLPCRRTSWSNFWCVEIAYGVLILLKGGLHFTPGIPPVLPTPSPPTHPATLLCRGLSGWMFRYAAHHGILVARDPQAHVTPHAHVSTGSRRDTQFNSYSKYADTSSYWGLNRLRREGHTSLSEGGVITVQVAALDGVVELTDSILGSRARGLAEDADEVLALSSGAYALASVVSFQELYAHAFGEDGTVWDFSSCFQTDVCDPRLQRAFQHFFPNQVLSSWALGSPVTEVAV
jgi:hypothetical protein